jgi:hypothetical protein
MLSQAFLYVGDRVVVCLPGQFSKGLSVSYRSRGSINAQFLVSPSLDRCHLLSPDSGREESNKGIRNQMPVFLKSHDSPHAGGAAFLEHILQIFLRMVHRIPIRYWREKQRERNCAMPFNNFQLSLARSSCCVSSENFLIRRLPTRSPFRSGR